MSARNILLVGATGETGGDILDGLLEDGSFKITALLRPASAKKATDLIARGVETLILDLPSSPIKEIAKAIAPFDTIISAIFAWEQPSELALVDAAAKAGTCKRFVPCGFTIVCPPSGVMRLRDVKETVYSRIWYHHLPYTFIDVGYWHQLSWPTVPSGKLDYASLTPKNFLYGDNDPANLLTDKRDIGRFVTRIVKDPRTINHKVFTWSDALTQKDIFEIVEKATGEKVDYEKISSADLVKRRAEAVEAWETNETDSNKLRARAMSEYILSKYVRGDNTPENAVYLGYLDARALYPDFKPTSFAAYIDELVKGLGKRPYGQV